MARLSRPGRTRAGAHRVTATAPALAPVRRRPLDDVYTVPPIDSASARRLGHRPPLPVQDSQAIELVNAALYLRRPLLVTGEPGSGKSTLAHALAHELGLGRVLQWPIVSRTELRSGLYTYDAIGRLQDAQLDRTRAEETAESAEARHDPSIGRYIRLGPLGTALLAMKRPRVLLIDELDKSDIDLPNDLLNIVEEGEFGIPELERIADRPGQGAVQVLTDDGLRVPVTGGRIRCHAFPVIVMTSNGEREVSRAAAAPLHPPAPRPAARRPACRPGPGSLRGRRRPGPPGPRRAVHHGRDRRAPPD